MISSSLHGSGGDRSPPAPAAPSVLLSDLPHDILDAIAGHLAPRDVLALAGTAPCLRRWALTPAAVAREVGRLLGVSVAAGRVGPDERAQGETLARSVAARRTLAGQRPWPLPRRQLSPAYPDGTPLALSADLDAVVDGSAAPGRGVRCLDPWRPARDGWLQVPRKVLGTLGQAWVGRGGHTGLCIDRAGGWVVPDGRPGVRPVTAAGQAPPALGRLGGVLGGGRGAVVACRHAGLIWQPPAGPWTRLEGLGGRPALLATDVHLGAWVAAGCAEGGWALWHLGGPTEAVRALTFATPGPLVDLDLDARARLAVALVGPSPVGASPPAGADPSQGDGASVVKAGAHGLRLWRDVARQGASEDLGGLLARRHGLAPDHAWREVEMAASGDRLVVVDGEGGLICVSLASGGSLAGLASVRLEAPADVGGGGYEHVAVHPSGDFLLAHTSGAGADLWVLDASCPSIVHRWPVGAAVDSAFAIGGLSLATFGAAKEVTFWLLAGRASPSASAPAGRHVGDGDQVTEAARPGED